MAKFDLKKAILENKATFFGSLTEGQFSWFTQDTDQQIGSEPENTLPFVYMHDNKGNKWLEKNYEGYGVFGGKDYYELLDQMNGGDGDRSRGIDLAFDKEAVEAGKVLFPALTVSSTLPSYHSFNEAPKDDPNQSWYTPEEDEYENDYDSYFGDMDREEDYEDEEEIDEAELPALTADQVENIAQQVADKFSKTDDLDIKFTITPGSVEASPKGAGFDLDTIAGPNTPGDDWKDENGFNIDDYLGQYAGGSYVIKMEDGKYKIYNAANQNAYVGYVTPQGEVVFEIPGFEGTMDQLNSLEEEKPKTKMKKSELKAKIKEMIVAEMTLDIDNMENAPESEVDFLAEVDAILAEADEVAVDDTEVAVDGEENIDVDTTAEVDPNVKAVQDALTQAQAAAQKLGDPKLTDQIGNTITFFTRAHVVDKGAVAEGKQIKETNNPEVWKMFDLIRDNMDDDQFLQELIAAMDTDEAMANLKHIIQMYDLEDYGSMRESKKEYYKDAEADDAEHIKALEKDMKDDKESSMKIKEVVFPMWTKLNK